MSFLSDASIPHDAASPKNDSTRKRGRDEQDAKSAIDRRPFTIQTDPSDPFSKPRTFTPVCLLERAQLPLAYLDTTPDGSRLFAALVSLLEASYDCQDQANVLIVEDGQAGRLYAIERVRRRRYALCRLGLWVKEQDVLERATLDVRPSEPPRKRRLEQVAGAGQPWWMSASVQVKNGADNSTWLNGKPPKLRMDAAFAPSQDLPVALDGPRGLAADEPRSNDATSLKPSPSPCALEELSKHYLEAVYLSRTPLAYFVKGPLARARTAFAAQPMELISFLRGAILSSTVMDKKFRDTIADHVKEMPLFEPEASAVKPKPRKKRKWKSKRDKSGLFVDEKDHIEQWWRKHDDLSAALGSAETVEHALRRRTPLLRSRETFLQIVLVLETLALEAALPATEPIPACDGPESVSQAMESQPIAEAKKPRKKKDSDIFATLETLIDRLCIWHTLQAHTPIKTGANGSGGSQDEISDALKTFASEVIMPFYGGRIPEQANATSKKLGGPAMPTPGKKALSAPRRPGEPAVRQGPEKKPRRPLGRVSTDTLNRTDPRPPTLHRSATDSSALLPHIKRENSETPISLEAIPSARNSLQPNKAVAPKRATLLEQMSANRREVDLSAVAKANEQRLLKAARVQEQVRDAIVNVRKPNRVRAIEEVAKTTDESFAKAVGKGKTSGNTHQQRRVADKTAGTIGATPRMIKATPAPKRRTQQAFDQSVSFVPSSSTRLFARPADVPPSSSIVPATGHRVRHTSNVEETPSRGFAHYMPKGLARPPGTLLESPTANRTAPIISETPSRPLAHCVANSPAGGGLGFASRLEAGSYKGTLATGDRREDSGVGFGNGGNAVYAELGWDMSDDYEELD